MTITTKSPNEFHSSLQATQARYAKDFTETSNNISSRRLIVPREDNLFQKFITSNPHNPLVKTLESFSWVNAHIQTITYPFILAPRELPLIKLAQKYQEKYGIHLAVVNIQHLGAFLADVKQLVKEPTYIGIIATGNSHFSPILAHLNPEGSDSYVNLDGTVSGKELQNILEDISSPLNSVFSVSKTRQADGGSCRTEAAVILRNALIHLKSFNGGFSEALATGVLEGTKIIHLPPVWDYTSQISNKFDGANNHVVLRNAYSKDEEKRSKKETVAEFRQRHTKTFEFEYTLTKEASGDQSIWKTLEDTSMMPCKVTLSVKDQELADLFDIFEVSISFALTREVNDYLYDKGREIVAQYS